jgi:beta-alanine degradation protein BauB
LSAPSKTALGYFKSLMHDPETSSVTAGANFSGWSASLIEELKSAPDNGKIGTRLLSECSTARIWEVRLAPAQRLGFHHHVLDYFWTVLSPGKALSRTADGLTRQLVYERGDTKELRYAKGEGMIHDLENIGSTELLFVTVEFLDSANSRLGLGKSASSDTNDQALRSLLFRSYEAEAEPTTGYFCNDSDAGRTVDAKPKSTT